MTVGRPKGTADTRRLILQAFYDEYLDKLSRFERKWPQFWKPEVRSNSTYWHDSLQCMMLPSLSFTDIRKVTGLSDGTLSSRLRNLVTEKTLSPRKGRLRGYTLIRSMEWLVNECQPPIHIRQRKGRPRKILQPEDELRIMSVLRRLPHSEIDFLTSKGLRFKQKDGRVVAYFHSSGTGLDPRIGQMMRQIRKEQEFEQFAKRQKKRLGLK